MSTDVSGSGDVRVQATSALPPERAARQREASLLSIQNRQTRRLNRDFKTKEGINTANQVSHHFRTSPVIFW